jgi:hypothetical protein
MPVRKVEVERFSLTTSRPFESVVCALKSGIGQLDLAAFASASKSSGTFAELEEVINRNIGESGLMLFLEFDHGAVVRKDTGLAKPKIMRHKRVQRGEAVPRRRTIQLCRFSQSSRPAGR